MLSPHTPPGTHVILTWSPKTIEEAASLFVPEYHDHIRFTPGATNKVGTRYVLAHIERCLPMVSGFCATVYNQKGSFALECLSVAELPKVLTDILISDRIPEDA